MTAPQPRRKRRFWRKLTIVSVLGAGLFLAVNGDARAAVANFVKNPANSNPGG